MARIYFYPELVDKAKDILKSKGAVDKVKAKNDLEQIDAILQEYIASGKYDQITVVQLDERIRREYNIIQDIDKLSSQRQSSTLIADIYSDPYIDNLNEDQYGIFYDVLLKEGLVHTLEDFVKKVE